ncbi:hypothetical protein EKG38_21895 [Shewanella canadensis]|uniref:Uncharacterized protein n=1 Tax=Shewanella canadensis TaxID=271096 RepID=A0A3S0IP70_9GAMM|nr:hypothetical protein [Shewanella canadensis]RTR36783.1 hypothetical protein EKG38_21895 [Shewanella canadensis]
MYQVSRSELDKQQVKYSKKLEKAEAKLLKNQHKLIHDIDNIDLVSKRLNKQVKYRAKIQKYRLKLASQVNNELTEIAVSTDDDANSARYDLPISSATHSMAALGPTGLTQTIELSRPFKIKPCQSCPALKLGLCRCAIKANKRTN